MASLISIPIFAAAFLLLALAWHSRKNYLKYFALKKNNPHFSNYYADRIEYWAVQAAKAFCAFIFFFLLAIFISVAGVL